MPTEFWIFGALLLVWSVVAQPQIAASILIRLGYRPKMPRVAWSPLASSDKGRLRWDDSANQWRWIATGPKLQVVGLRNGEFRVKRVRA